MRHLLEIMAQSNSKGTVQLEQSLFIYYFKTEIDRFQLGELRQA